MSEILQNLQSATLIPAIEANFNEEMASFGRALPGAELHEDDELTWFYTGRPHLNGILHTHLRSNNAAYVNTRIAETLAYFQARHVSLGWAVGPGTYPTNLGPYLEAHGFERKGETPGMALLIPATLPTLPEIDAFEIREVRDNEELQQLCRVEMSSFETSEEATRNYYETYRQLGFGPGRSWQHFIGWLHGEAVASISLLFYAGVAGIYGVSTLPQARQRGIATAMTLHALTLAQARDYRVAILSPSDMSFRIYERLGFRTYCSLQHFGWTLSHE